MISIEYKNRANMFSVETAFSQWLMDELKKRGWNQSDLSRASGVSRGTISNILNGTRGVGEETLNSIARAFRIPPEEVFRSAGLLPAVSPGQSAVDELNYLLNMLDEDNLKEVIDYARHRLEKQTASKKNTKQSSRSKRPARTV